MAPAAWHCRLRQPGSDLFLPGHRPRAAEQLQLPAHQGTDDEPRVGVRPPPHQQEVGPGLLEPVPPGIATLSIYPSPFSSKVGEMGGAGGLRNLTFAISTMRFQDNDLMVPANRLEVIDALFPLAARELHECPLDVFLDAQAVYLFRHHSIGVVHNEKNLRDPLIDLEIKGFIDINSGDTSIFITCRFRINKTIRYNN